MKRTCFDKDVMEIPHKCAFARKIKGIVMCCNTKETLKYDLNSNPKRCLEDHFPKKVE